MIRPKVYVCGHTVKDSINAGCRGPGSDACRTESARNTVEMGAKKMKKIREK